MLTAPIVVVNKQRFHILKPRILRVLLVVCQSVGLWFALPAYIPNGPYARHQTPLCPRSVHRHVEKKHRRLWDCIDSVGLHECERCSHFWAFYKHCVKAVKLPLAIWTPKWQKNMTLNLILQAPFMKAAFRGVFYLRSSGVKMAVFSHSGGFFLCGKEEALLFFFFCMKCILFSITNKDV